MTQCHVYLLLGDIAMEGFMLVTRRPTQEILVWRFYRFCKNTFLDWFGYGYNPLLDHSCLEYIKDLHRYNIINTLTF